MCVFVCFISPFMLCSAMGLVPEIKLCMYVCMYRSLKVLINELISDLHHINVVTDNALMLLAG